MIDTSMVKTLLKHEAYVRVKDRLRPTLFAEDVRDAFEILTKAHEKYEHDLSTNDLSVLWKADNPVATGAEVNDFRELLEDIESAEELSSDITSDAIDTLWRRDIGKQVSQIGLDISEGNDDAMVSLRSLVENIGEAFVPDDFGPETSQELEDLLELFSDEHRFKFNIPTLARQVYGPARQDFVVLFATPETGKTAFVVSLSCGPEGFVEQGLKVLILGNEEATKRTVVRAYQCVTGLTGEQIVEDPEMTRAIYKAKTDGKLVFKDIQDWDMAKVDAYIAKVKPDVVFIDQLDKVHIHDRFEKGHERLRNIYQQAREMAKRNDVALFGVSQASNDATGRTRLTYDMMEGSKIGKAAEADLIIGIGKDTEDGAVGRYLTVSKNKLSGYHGTILCNIQPEISRYVA